MHFNCPLLSPRQAQLCQTIERLARERGGVPPSMREVSVALGLHPSRVAQLAATAEAKGALIREPRVARSWRVVKDPKSRRDSC